MTAVCVLQRKCILCPSAIEPCNPELEFSNFLRSNPCEKLHSQCCPICRKSAPNILKIQNFDCTTDPHFNWKLPASLRQWLHWLVVRYWCRHAIETYWTHLCWPLVTFDGELLQIQPNHRRYPLQYCLVRAINFPVTKPINGRQHIAQSHTHLMPGIKPSRRHVRSTDSFNLFHITKSRLLHQRIKIANDFVQYPNASFPVFNVLGIKILEIRYRSEHNAAHFMHFGVQFVGSSFG